ncbi:glycoside hydrolase family 95 protein, partial [Pseudoxanthomonas sp. SGD-10]
LIPNVYEGVVEMRKLLFDGKYKQAQDLSNKIFPRQAPEGGNYGMQYQTAGSLLLNFNHTDISNYRRNLDISNAIASVSYQSAGVDFKREYIALIPQKVIVIRLTASKPRSVSFELDMNAPFTEYKKEALKDRMKLSGVSSTVDGKTGRVRFENQVVPKLEGGTLSTQNNKLVIKNANAVTLFISIGTNFNNYKDITGNESQRVTERLKAVINKSSYESLKNSHVRAYQTYFNRVKLDLGTTSAMNKPTDQRVFDFKQGNDPALVSLYFQFGRYLLICSSFPGSQPANLQGKWNEKLSPPWDSKYTVNINTEMNYWPAEVTDLPEMHEPLFKMLKELAETGKESASQMYKARGWNLHHNTDLWRITGVVDGGFYGIWPMGGAWLSQHIWQHYLYNGNTQFLREYYDVLKGAAMFYVDVLQEEPTNKWLVVAPSMSPENTYLPSVGVTAGATMDNQLVFDVFSNYIKSSEILQLDKAFADTVRTMIKRLPPMQVGQHTQLQEWLHDWDRKEDKHRHVSHLYGLYPSNQISPYRHPELFEASRNSLIYRGDKSTGWSMGWKVNLWARLLDGNQAYKLIEDQLTPAPEEQKGQNGGTYPNLLDAHPPFQIDGNFGCTSGIAEMLLQSHDGDIHLLPALPDRWKSGSVSGLVARGGFVIDMKWENGKISYLKIHSKLGGNCRIRIHSSLKAKSDGVILKPAQGENSNGFYQVADIKQPLVSDKATINGVGVKKGSVYDFQTKKGGNYEFLNM